MCLVSISSEELESTNRPYGFRCTFWRWGNDSPARGCIVRVHPTYNPFRCIEHLYFATEACRGLHGTVDERVNRAEGPSLPKAVITEGTMVAPFQNMLVTLGNLTFANQRSLIQTTSNVGRSSRINDHIICTNTARKINQMEVDTLTIDQSWVKEGSTLQITVNRLPSASLSRLMNTRAPTRFNGYVVAHRSFMLPFFLYNRVRNNRAEAPENKTS